jgi:hypothetical protein
MTVSGHNGVSPGSLYQRIVAGAEAIGCDFGDSALDVGGRNGLYTPVIRRLGVGRVTIVDPATDQLQYAVDRHIVQPEDTYAGTLQQYVDENAEPAGSAFVFNMYPPLAADIEFLDALGRAVKAGGWIVASLAEPATSNVLHTTMRHCQKEAVSLRGAAPDLSLPLSMPHIGPNHYIQFWQRH